MSTQAVGPVTLSHKSPHVVLVTLTNPPVNVLDRATRDELGNVFEQLAADGTARCVVLTGSGRTFSAGADLAEESEMTGSAVPAFVESLQRFLNAIERLRAPVIAAIDGPCIGGGLELALACDIRLGTPAVRFVAAGVNVGLIASVTGLQRIVGESRAKHMLLSGEPIDAGCAERWGLVTGVYESESLITVALELAERIASRPPLAVEAAKQVLARTRDLGSAGAQKLEHEMLIELFRTEDHKEAVQAFLGKRNGSFVGR